MKLTCLSTGDGLYCPPSHVLDICGFKVLIDCPINLSALTIFAPISTDNCCHYGYTETSDSDTESLDLSPQFCKRRRFEKPLEASHLISAEPWYKVSINWQCLDVSLIDIVLISSPMGMLGLPYLTRAKEVTAKVYATEATAKLGRLMMEDLVSMHSEFRQVYGPEEGDRPQWMEEQGMLNQVLRESVLGGDEANSGCWKSLYSAADVEDCLKKIQTMKYAEEVFYNGTLMLKPFSSGLEIGASNWVINGPRRNCVYLSNSLFGSTHAMEFDYHSLQGNDLILFSDFSYLHGSRPETKSLLGGPITPRSSVIENGNNEEASTTPLVDKDEGSEEVDKVVFVASCVVNSVKGGGCAIIPIGRLGVILQLLEQISGLLEALNLKVPVYMISSVAEETLALTSIVPEWVSKERQEKLFTGEGLFGHVELTKERKLHVFPGNWSPDFVTAWQEPCIVFSSHWSLRLGPVTHLLQRWHTDPNSLLVLEEGIDAELALLPFKPVVMNVLQCSFLSGIKVEKIQPLLEILQPKLVLFPKVMKSLIASSDTGSISFLYYSENETLRIPSLKDFSEANLATDLVFQLKPKRMRQEDMAIARLRGELQMKHGKYLLQSATFPDSSQRQLLYWGSVDPKLLLAALESRGVRGSITKDSTSGNENALIQVDEPSKAVLEIGTNRTVISSADKQLVAQILEAVSDVLDCI